MKQNLDLKFASQTHTGKVRLQNEDSVAVLPAYGLAILADGMGGYNAGEVASAMATSILQRELAADLADYYRTHSHKGNEQLHQMLQSHINKTNEIIFHASAIQSQYAGMGTTLVLALFRPGEMTVAHIGDSRMYRLRGDELAQMTRDHSLLQDQIDAGLVTPEQAKLSLNKNLLTRALGVDPVVEAEIRDYATREGDMYLMCSDGLTDMISDLDIKQTLQLWSAEPEVAVEKLIHIANENGGRDNVSVILIQVESQNQPSMATVSRFMNWLK